MFRDAFIGGFVALLFSATALVAQNQLSPLPSTPEPPIATPGEMTAAPSSTIIVPGQPRPLPPNLDARPAQPAKEMSPDEPEQGIQPAQFTYPAPATAPPVAPAPSVTATPAPYAPGARPPAAPTVLLPEPLVPMVKIAVKGMDIAPTGQEVTYRFTVSNPSEAKAYGVVARCPIPKGAALIKSLPEAQTVGKELEWKLGTLNPGDSRIIEVVFKPDDGVTELKVIGKVQFEHGRYVVTKLANPTLDMKKTGPAQGVLDDPMTYKIIVKNPGKVPVTDTQIVNTLAEGLEYIQETAKGAVPASKTGPASNQRTWTLGTLAPGESRTLEYRVMPRRVGDWTSEAVATGTGAQARAGCNTMVQEAKLTLQVNGPPADKATANQAAPFFVVVHNTGTATLHNVRVSCTFPTELRVKSASNGGHLFHDAVQWVVPKLEPSQAKELSFSLIAPSAGLRDVVASARAEKGLEQRKKLSTVFVGVPALDWHIEGTAVAAIDQEVVYTITLKNPGTGPVKNVKIIADLPDQVEFRQAQPTFQRGQSAVFFNPLDVAPQQTVTLKVVCVAKKGGDARFQFEMSSEGISAGPLKSTKATTISPSGEPKKLDTPRIASDPSAPAPKKLDAQIVPASSTIPDMNAFPPPQPPLKPMSAPNPVAPLSPPGP
jgi:uncharacterized repeat protein (TIGR01451 family)